MHPHLNEGEPFLATLRWLMRGSRACRVPSCSRGAVPVSRAAVLGSSLQNSSLAGGSGSWLTSASTGLPSLTHLINLTGATKQTEGIAELAALPWEHFPFNSFTYSPVCSTQTHIHAQTSTSTSERVQRLCVNRRFVNREQTRLIPAVKVKQKNCSCKAYCRGQELPAQMPPLTDPLTCGTILQGIIPVYIGTFVLKRTGHISLHI